MSVEAACPVRLGMHEQPPTADLVASRCHTAENVLKRHGTQGFLRVFLVSSEAQPVAGTLVA